MIYTGYALHDSAVTGVSNQVSRDYCDDRQVVKNPVHATNLPQRILAIP